MHLLKLNKIDKILLMYKIMLKYLSKNENILTFKIVSNIFQNCDIND